jgi:hypothetical protein
MGELAQAMQMIGRLGLNVIKYPSGKWGFVGRVPSDLAWIKQDGSTPTPEECNEVAQASFRAMVCKRLGIHTRTFTTEQEARDTAKAAGYSIDN